MIRRALLAAALVAGAMVSVSDAQDDSSMVLWVEPDGSVYLRNNSASETFNLAGYSIVSEHNDLFWQDFDGTKGWKAFEDLDPQFPSDAAAAVAQLGEAAMKMGSAGPVPSNLTELSLNPAGLEFSPGEGWFIGKPFSKKPTDDAGDELPGYSFLFKDRSLDQFVGAIVTVPEPSTVLLATLAGLGLVGWGIRSKSAVRQTCGQAHHDCRKLRKLRARQCSSRCRCVICQRSLR